MTLTFGKELNLELMVVKQLDACLRYGPVCALPTFCQLFEFKKVGGEGCYDVGDLLPAMALTLTTHESVMHSSSYVARVTL